jgi:hypothetical protein
MKLVADENSIKALKLILVSRYPVVFSAQAFICFRTHGVHTHDEKEASHA